MKIKNLLLAATICIAFLHESFAQLPNYVSPTGLVGWWSFTGNANDESGSGNNGIVNGATLTADRFSNSNTAYSFDGSNNRVEVALNNTIGNDVTISVWYSSISPNGGPFVHIGHDNGGAPYCDGFNIGKGGNSINNAGDDLISGFSCTGYYYMLIRMFPYFFLSLSSKHKL